MVAPLGAEFMAINSENEKHVFICLQRSLKRLTESIL